MISTRRRLGANMANTNIDQLELIANQVEGIIDKSLPFYSNLANASAILMSMGELNWAGFYIVEGDELVLGPFQGEVACVRIQKGKGVCGTSLEKKETIIVPNVHEFPGHIACSHASNSEIVVPIFKGEKVIALIDLDSPKYSRFGEEEKKLLEKVADRLSEIF